MATPHRIEDVTGRSTDVPPEFGPAAIKDKARIFLVMCDVVTSPGSKFEKSTDEELANALAARADFEVNLSFSNGVYLATWVPRN